MKKKFAFVIALLLSGASLMAQKNVETVYLKNGSVIRGTIIEQVPGQSLKVQTKDGSVFVYQMDEVERIAKEVQSTTSASVGQYGHGHRGLDFSVEGGLLLGKAGSVAGGGGIELGKRFNQNFYWGVGVGVLGGNGADAQIPITTTFKALFPVTASGIAPNVAFRTGFVYNTGEDETYGSGKYAVKVEAKHGWEIGLMPGVQIPLGQKVDFNFNLGYQCNVTFGGGAGHSFVMNAGFGFHKPYEKITKTKKTKKPKKPTRDQGVQYGIELPIGFGANSLIDIGPAFVLGYKINPNLSVALGYHAGGLSVDRNLIEESIGDSYYGGGRTDEDSEQLFGGQHSLFLRGQYRVIDKRLSPIASVDIGFRKYNFDDGNFLNSINDSYEIDKKLTRSAGFLFSPAVGASLRTTNNSYLELKVGYHCTNGLKEAQA